LHNFHVCKPKKQLKKTILDNIDYVDYIDSAITLIAVKIKEAKDSIEQYSKLLISRKKSFFLFFGRYWLGFLKADYFRCIVFLKEFSYFLEMVVLRDLEKEN
jgi:hypothetical protein